MQTKLFTLALGSLLAFGATTAALAQDNPPPTQDQNQATPRPDGPHGRGMHMDPNRQLEHLTRQLNLTADQQAQIKPMLVERQQKMQALFQDQSLSQEDRRTQMRTISEGTRNSIKAVLTDEQKQKFDTMREHGRHGGPGGPPPDSSSPQPQN